MWELSNKKAKIFAQDSSSVSIEVVTGRSGSFDIKYIRENQDDIVLNVTIQSL